MGKIRKVSLSIGIVMVAVFLAACGKQSSQNNAQNKSITLMQTSDLTSLDNTNQAMLPEFNTLTNISEGLYRLNSKDQPVPAMATKIVKPTDNGKKYVFHIRSNAKWSNGDPVKAEDFEYSWKRSLARRTTRFTPTSLVESKMLMRLSITRSHTKRSELRQPATKRLKSLWIIRWPISTS